MNYEYDFEDRVKGIKNLECAFIQSRDKDCIHQTKYDGLCG